MRENKYLKEVCKIGQAAECCRYVTCGPNGFECGKLDPRMRFTLDYRVLMEQMTAQGDNCEGVEELNGQK